MPPMKPVEMEVCKQFEFAAHHILPYHEPCSVHHGHNFKVTLCVKGLIQPDDPQNYEAGMVVSFGHMKEEIEAVRTGFLDHKSLNDLLANPTCERLTAWLVEYFDEAFSKNTGAQLSRLRVTETDRSWAEWQRS